jgi:hypothetical protein
LITLSQLAGSTEPIQFAINAIDDEGSSYDPTGWPVAVAFAAVTSPPAAFDPDTATWNTASWSVQAGNPEPVYWVNVMPGPANGGIPVTAGGYTAYVKITTDSAVPVLPAAYVIFS